MSRGGLVQAKICDFSTPWLSRFAVDTVISVNRIFFIGHQGSRGPSSHAGPLFYFSTVSVPASMRGRYYNVVGVGDAEKR
jgi:hypothetical protein